MKRFLIIALILGIMAIPASLQAAGNVGSIYVTSDPAGAEVYMDGAFIGNTPLLSDVPAGKHNLSIGLSGYNTGYRTVTVTPGVNSRAHVGLSRIAPPPATRPAPKYTPTPEPTAEPQKSTLSITTQPEGATVYIDGEKVGKSPIDGKEVAPGNRNIRLVLSGYSESNVSVYVSPGEDASFEKKLISAKAPGTLVLKSVPPKARVYINEKDISEITPIKPRKMPEGKYKIKLTLKGYHPMEKTITIKSGKSSDETLVLKSIKTETGTLLVDSRPSGAKIILDGKEVAVTPKTLEKVPAGEHVVKIELNGYKPLETTVIVEGNKTQNVSAELVSTGGTLLINSIPPSASAFLNGEFQDKTPVKLEGVKPGEYTVKIVREGYQTFEQNIAVEEGKEVEVSAELTKISADLSLYLFWGLIGLTVIMLIAGILKSSRKKEPIPALSKSEPDSRRVAPLGAETVISTRGRSPELASGTALGNWVITGKLANGSTGVIYDAVHKSKKEPAAIKIPYDALLGTRNFGRRFMKSAERAKSLSHPNIMRVLEAADIKGIPYAVEEKVAGEDLQKIIRREAPLDLRKVFQVVLGVLDALDYGHSRNVIHGYLKPENIVITSGGKIKVLDFGMAHSIFLLDIKGSYAGLPTYISPEHFGGKMDQRSDLYSLGVIFFEMVTGRPPFSADQPMVLVEAHKRQPPPTPRTLNPNLPHQVDAIIMRLLQKNPAERFQNAKEVVAVIRKFLQGIGE
ncbi:MAG: PEGA domain-containing protein [Chloroflexi bacterium]|nr:PEGA domain-containing protein [Chloroflexota bacterium]